MMRDHSARDCTTMKGTWSRRAAAGVGALFIAGCTSRAVSPPGPAPSVHPVELHLERSLSIEIGDDFQPSGLVLRGERLLTVSDKDDTAVYEIVLGEAAATLRTFVSFTPPAVDPPTLDLEGITLGSDQALLLASETHFRVLRVEPSGNASWMTPSLEAVGHGAGLFQKRNANLEGILRLSDGRLLLAAEREPRGLVELPANAEVSGARAWSMPESKYPVPAGRNADFADLASADGDIYALERSSHLIVRLERTENRWEEREAWSYARTENDPRFAYGDSRYGVAEGLAIDRDHVFLVTDNNRLARAGDPNDRRPQLFVFTRPARTYGPR
jgi:hypothetical protein